MKTSYRETPTRRGARTALLLLCFSASTTLFSIGCTKPEKVTGGLWTPEALTESLVRGESPRAILVLNEDVVPGVPLRGTVQGTERLNTAAAKVAAYSRTKDDLLGQVPALAVIHRYEQLPMLAVTVQSEAAVNALFSRRDVAQVYREEFLTRDSMENLNLINQPVAQDRGYGGSGTSVAVLDTGVDYTRDVFGSCSAAGLPATCKVAYAADFAPNDAQLDDASGHGSNVAGIILSVAPQTRILALDVFNKTSASSLDIIKAINWVVANQSQYNIAAINMSLSTRDAYSTACDGRSAFARAIAAARNAGVLTVVASGNGGFANMISNPGCVSTAVSVGAVYDSDIGHGYFENCDDAVTAADKVACFSNSAPFLTLLAPGVRITDNQGSWSGTSQAAPHVAGAIAVLKAAFPTNTPDETVGRLTGAGPLVLDPRNGVSKPRLDLDGATQTCFHALSARSQVVPPEGGSFSITVDDTSPSGCSWTAISSAAWVTLTSGTAGVGDATVSFTVAANEGGPRSSVLTIAGQSLAVTQLSDKLPPTGTVKILGTTLVGATPFVPTQDVLLDLTATDASGVAQMCLSNHNSCQSWEPFTTSKQWTLLPGSGPKTVSVWYRDTRGNSMALPVTDAVTLDNTPPSAVAFTASASAGQVVLNWTVATDALSGLAGYRLVSRVGELPDSQCKNSSEIVYDGPDTTFTHRGLSDGLTYYYRLCPYDALGNLAPGSTLTARPAPEYVPPSGSVSVNLPTYGGRKYTVDLNITLTLMATDDSGVTRMCISNTPTCPREQWEDFTSYKEWTLTTPPSETTRTIYVWFSDAFGNRNTTPFKDTVTVDRSPPSVPNVRTSGSSTQIVVTWTASVDAGSGVRDYRLLEAEGATPPANCSSGVQIYSGTGTSFARMGLVDGASYSYRVCSYDNVGNASVGGTTTDRPAPEYDAPTGLGVSIIGGTFIGNTRWLGNPNVQLALTAEDPSGVQMCLNNSPGGCSTWVPFTQTASWVLTSGTGQKTVYAFFKDNYNNQARVPVSDSIWMDQSPPIDGGALTATGSSTQVALSWGVAVDAQSGLSSYKVVYKNGAAPAAGCSDGTAIYTGLDTSFVHTDLTDGATYNYRVCAVDRMNNVSAGVTASARPAPEYSPPEAGTVMVMNTLQVDNLRYVGSTATTLAITAIDESMIEMCVSNAPTCTAWEPLTPTRAWSLAGGTGTKTVYVFLRDVYGNVAPLPATDTVVLDLTAPGNVPSVTAVGGNAQVSLSWSAATDAHSGVGGYKVVFATNSAPASCAAGTFAYQGPETSFVHSGLVNGTTYYYRVCTVDAVGNVATGVTASARTAEEYNPPTDGMVTVMGTASNNGQRYVGTTAVALAISVTDESGVQMCVSNNTTCTTWETFAPTKNWTLASGAGSKTVYVFFRDSFGNTAPSPATDTVILDLTPPSEVTGLEAAGGDRQVELHWLPSTDLNAGVSGYKVAFSQTAALTSCNSGVVYQGPETSFTHLGPNNGVSAYYRVCAYDGVNNVSSGASISVKPAPEYDPPSSPYVSVRNAVNINGTAYVSTQNVTLDIQATDVSPLQMCVSNSTSCTAWETYTTSRSWALTTGAGSKQVYVFFRDIYNNLNTTPATAAVTYDPTAPSEATGLTATGNSGSVLLNWDAATDSASGVGGYKIVFGTTTPTAGCQSGLVIYAGPETTFVHQGLPDGTTYFYRVCAYDNVGNVSAGVTTSSRPAPEYDPPTAGSVNITNAVAVGQSRFIGTITATLNISALDQNMMQMCVSNTATCTAWEAFTGSRNWTLPGGAGPKTVYVFFRDIYNNLAPSPATDTVILDQTVPSEVSGLTAVGASESVALSWTAATDASSGVAGYKIAESTTSSPGNCSTNVIYSGPETSFTHIGLINGSVHYYRVCAYDNVNNTSAGVVTNARPAPEYDAPTDGTVLITGAVTSGASRYVGTTSVQLAISASDASPMQMCVSNATTCTAWETFSGSKSWSLPTGAGTKVVRVFFRDVYGNVASQPASDTVILDQTAPSDPTLLTATGASGAVTLSWTPGIDSSSGIGGTRIVFGTANAPANCSTGTVLYEGLDTSYIHTGLTNGSVYYYRACALDKVNNMSAGVTTSARPAPEYDPPANLAVVVAGTVTSGGSRYIGVTSVQLFISATDESPMQMCVSNTTTCTTWENYSTNKSWSLPTSTGAKAVRVFFRDIYGNVAAAPALDTVTLDQTLPSNVSSVTATGSGASVELRWPAATDADSGVAGYRVVFGTSSPTSCAGTAIYSGPETVFTHTGLTDGATYYYRVCTIDNVGNISVGTTASARPAPEYDPPTAGSVLVANTVTSGDVRFIGTTNVTLNISAIDISMIQMCVSAIASCTNWEAMTPTKSWTFSSGTGTKVVYVFFRDVYNNVAAAPATDTVTLDQTLPANVASVTATGADAHIDLTWPEATDAHSGVGGYKVVYSTTASPASCSVGTALYSGPALSFSHLGLTNGPVYYYRVCTVDAVGNVSAGVAASARPAPEFDPPTAGSVTIMGAVTVGLQRYVSATNVTLAITASDASAMQMCVSATAACTNWETFATTKSWILSSGTGTRNVYVYFRDIYLNTATAPATDTVILDQTLPGNVASVAATGSDSKIDLSWPDATDAHSGVGGYKVVYSTSSSPTSCVGPTVAYSGTASTFTHAPLTNGTTYYYRVCTLDNVGNISAGTTASARPAPEYDPPAAASVAVMGTVTSAGQRYIGTTNVTLSLSATDASAMQMCISANTTCTSWETFAATKSWPLASGTGSKTVYAYFRDIYNNVTASPATDTVILDQTSPSNVASVTATGSDGRVDLTWPAGSDAHSGVGGYKVVFSNSSAPASCSAGTTLYNGPALTFTHTGLTNGTAQYYRVCTVDAVGNVSAGVTASARPAPEYDPPVGSISVQGTTSVGGTKYIATPSVSLLLTATDANPISMCVSNNTSCTTFETFAGTKSWSLPAGSGPKTVYLTLKDSYGNTAAAVTDVVVLDQTAPTDGTVTPVGSDRQISLSWSGATDAHSGIASYKVVYSTASAPAASCSSGITAYAGTSSSFIHAGLTNGTTYFYRVCAIDSVGNVSGGAATSAIPAPEYDPPTGEVIIGDGGAYITSTNVTLSISATDLSGVSQMCVSNTSTCSSWETYATTKNWVLTSGSGDKTVSVWFRDAYGNVTPSPAEAMTTLDNVAPSAFTATAVGGSQSVSLNWTASSDETSGLSHYTVQMRTDTAPTSCLDGTRLYAGEDQFFTANGLTSGATSYFRVCAWDRAGNTTSVTASAQAQ